MFAYVCIKSFEMKPTFAIITLFISILFRKTRIGKFFLPFFTNLVVSFGILCHF